MTLLQVLPSCEVITRLRPHFFTTVIPKLTSLLTSLTTSTRSGRFLMFRVGFERLPVPGQKFMQTIVLMIVDAPQHVG